MNNFAHLKSESPWYGLFPQGRAPIRNILLPRLGNMIGGGGVQEFFDLDVNRLSPEQFERVAGLVAAQCSGTVAEVREWMRSNGFLPLRAVHVASTSSDIPAFL